MKVGNQSSHKNSNSHIDASHSRQPLVKGERLVRYEVNAVMIVIVKAQVRHVDSRVIYCLLLGLWNAALQHQPCILLWLFGFVFVGSCSEANYLERNYAMDDSIGGS